MQEKKDGVNLQNNFDVQIEIGNKKKKKEINCFSEKKKKKQPFF